MSAPSDHTGASVVEATAPILAAMSNDGGVHVLRLARTLAVRMKAPLVCVSVVELPAFHRPLIGTAPAIPALSRRLAEKVEAQLAGRIDRLSSHSETPVHTSAEVQFGDPALCIASRARELGARLIVMGIGRHHPMDRILGADTALRTIENAPCPVLAVTRGTGELATDVVVGTDFSGASLAAARDALAVAAPAAALHFVHVWLPTADADDDLAAEEMQHRQQLPQRFRAFLARLAPSNPARTTFVVHEAGRITECLLDEAEHHGAGLIAVGRHGQNPLASLIVGSVATRVLRASTRAVLVSPPGSRELAVPSDLAQAPEQRAAAPASPR